MTGDDTASSRTSGPVIHDELEDSVAIRMGKMKIYIFHVVDGELRYNGSINAPERALSEVPADVVSKAESHMNLECAENTEENLERLEKAGKGPGTDQ